MFPFFVLLFSDKVGQAITTKSPGGLGGDGKGGGGKGRDDRRRSSGSTARCVCVSVCLFVCLSVWPSLSFTVCLYIVCVSLSVCLCVLKVQFFPGQVPR